MPRTSPGAGPSGLAAPVGGATRTLCLLSARRLGDAVMHASALDALLATGFAERILVWTFPEAACLFAGRPGVEIHTSFFPMGGTRDAFLRQPGTLWSAVRALRRARPTHTLDFIGDVRERVVAGLLGARVNVAPAWPPGHPFLPGVRGANATWWPLGRRQLAVPIPRDTINVYAAQQRVLEALVGRPLPGPRAGGARPASHARPPVIGCHPYASLPCKLWPRAHWQATLQGLQRTYPGMRLVLFGTPADAADLQRLAAESGVAADVFTASLPAFLEKIGRLDLLVSLDSLAAHVAHRQGVPAVTLVGPNDPAVWAPPTTTAVTHYGNCPFQPCSVHTRCEHTEFRYTCMRSITPAQVLAAVASRLDPPPREWV